MSRSFGENFDIFEDFEFTGNLEISNIDIENKVDQHLLVLASFFNDFKTILLFNNIVSHKFRKVEVNELTYHTGEMGGIQNYINKIMVAHIHELFIYLDQERKFFCSVDFLNILSKIKIQNKKAYLDWKEIFSEATNTSKTEKFIKPNLSNFLLAIRNKIAFHYDREELVKGYKDFFISRKSGNGSENPLFTAGGQLYNTRFHYADAAMQRYITLAGESRDVNFLIDVLGLTKKIANVMCAIISIYYIDKK